MCVCARALNLVCQHMQERERDAYTCLSSEREKDRWKNPVFDAFTPISVYTDYPVSVLCIRSHGRMLQVNAVHKNAFISWITGALNFTKCSSFVSCSLSHSRTHTSAYVEVSTVR